MKVKALTKHRFHIWGVGISYANLIGFAIGVWIAKSWF